jgi:hypothetical protein
MTKHDPHGAAGRKDIVERGHDRWLPNTLPGRYINRQTDASPRSWRTGRWLDRQRKSERGTMKGLAPSDSGGWLFGLNLLALTAAGSSGEPSHGKQSAGCSSLALDRARKTSFGRASKYRRSSYRGVRATAFGHHHPVFWGADRIVGQPGVLPAIDGKQKAFGAKSPPPSSRAAICSGHEYARGDRTIVVG